MSSTLDVVLFNKILLNSALFIDFATLKEDVPNDQTMILQILAFFDLELKVYSSLMS